MIKENSWREGQPNPEHRCAIASSRKQTIEWFSAQCETKHQIICHIVQGMLN